MSWFQGNGIDNIIKHHQFKDWEKKKLQSQKENLLKNASYLTDNSIKAKETPADQA